MALAVEEASVVFIISAVPSSNLGLGTGYTDSVNPYRQVVFSNSN